MSDADPPLKRLGDFELIREIGRGGMGIVYDARQVSLNRRVALKILPPGLGLTDQAVQRFEREAQAAAKLHHTNIVPVHAIGEDDGTHYYAMELIEGQALSDVLQDLSGSGTNPLMDSTLTMLGGGENQTDAVPDAGQSGPNLGSSGITSLSDSSSGSRKWFDLVARLVADVADALEYAHGRGVIHRDIKPANLMLSNAGRLCITDFGLARVAQEPGMTVSGSLMGTPAYMSPEQIASGRMKLDHRTDVYSLGAVLYEMLTHRRPFPGESREEILGGILTKEPRPPRRFNPRIPVDLETICQKAMEKDPDKRYATAGEFSEDLERYLAHGLIKARRAGVAKRAWKLVRRHPVVSLVIVGLIAVALVSVVAFRQYEGRTDETAQRLIADARLALKEGTYREGLQLIDRAVAHNPATIDARIVRARLLIVNHRMHEAADEAQSVLETDPQNYAAHTILAGLALHPSPDFRLVRIDPEPHMRVVEATAPESAEAYYLRALQTTDMRQRIGLLDRALDLGPDDQLASQAKMNALGQLMDFEVALPEADRQIATRPKSALGWQVKAATLAQLQDFENALAAINRALEIDERDSWNYLSRAQILFQMGEVDEALSDLNRSVELDPSRGLANGWRGFLLNHMGRFEEAIADARRAIELNPDDRLAFDVLLKSYLSLEQEENVRATIGELRAVADTWADAQARGLAYLDIASYYQTLREIDLALAAVERAIEIDPGTPLGFIRRMDIRRESGDAEGATADCEAAARVDLYTPVDLYKRGLLLLNGCGDVGGALEDFSRVVELAPSCHRGYLLRGAAYIRLRHLDRALVDINRAIELGPYLTWSYNIRGQLYLDLGRFDEAFTDVGKAIELDPYVHQHHELRGRVHEGLRHYDRALVDFNRAIELDPSFSQSYSSRGSLYDLLGRFDEALADKKKSVELNPDNAGDWAYYGFLLHWTGRPEEGLTALDRALELNPDADTRADRGRILADLGRCDEAAADIRRAEEMALDDPWPHRSIADAHLFFFYYHCPDHYDLAEALRHAQTVYESVPTNTWARKTQALALLRNGDYAEAKKFYLGLFEEIPDGASWFPLAMCLWHLGEKEEARRFYDRSVIWMDERLPDSSVFIKMRQEATELLGTDLPGADIVN